jgi:hypothetical protein
MALPIGETPILKGKQAQQFLLMVEKDAKIPSHPIATPKLARAITLIEKNAKPQQKRNR